MRLAASIGRGSKKSKKGKNNKKSFLHFLPFLFFLLPCIPQRLYDSLCPGAAATQRNARGAQRFPLTYWSQGIDSAQALKQSGIEQIAAPPDKAAEWRKAGFNVTALSQAQLHRREKLLTPRTAGRANVASATRRPWIDANGWRFARNPAGRFYYDLPPGKAALAAFEAFAYRADAILNIDPSDLEVAGRALEFLRSLPAENHPPVADIGVIDDGSDAMSEVMNLLARRNLLFRIVPSPSPRYRLNIRLGGKEYPAAEAEDPSAFAQKIRLKLGDENRRLRVYGTEVVICRLTGDDRSYRLHLLNYANSEIEGLRVKLLVNHESGDLRVFGQGSVPPDDTVNAGGVFEFSIPKMGAYAVLDGRVKK
jgi:hypothetical protein